MKTAAKIAVLVAVLLSGCPAEQTSPRAPALRVRDLGVTSKAEDGLTLTLELPRRRFVAGDRFRIRLTAHNASDRVIKIPAGPGAPIKVRIWRRTWDQWDEIKTYPQAAQRTTNPWRLAPAAKQNFEMLLTVEPDWPTQDTLGVVAELNGRPDLQVIQTITIASARDASGGG